MRAVLSYWQLPEDERSFLDFLQSTGDILAFPARGAKVKEELLPQPLVPYIDQDNPSQLYFGLERNAQQVIPELVEQGEARFFSVPSMKACLIGYRRGYFRDGNKLAQSSLSAYWDYPNEEATELLNKDPEFIKWAKRVLNWVRRAAPKQVAFRGGLCRATNRVRDAVQRGEVEVVPY